MAVQQFKLTLISTKGFFDQENFLDTLAQLQMASCN